MWYRWWNNIEQWGNTAQITMCSSGSRGGGELGGLPPPPPFRGFFLFFFACQYMKIPTDLDPNPPPPSKNSGPEPPPPFKEFLRRPIYTYDCYGYSPILNYIDVNVNVHVVRMSEYEIHGDSTRWRNTADRGSDRRQTDTLGMTLIGGGFYCDMFYCDMWNLFPLLTDRVVIPSPGFSLRSYQTPSWSIILMLPALSSILKRHCRKYSYSLILCYIYLLIYNKLAILYIYICLRMSKHSNRPQIFQRWHTL